MAKKPSTANVDKKIMKLLRKGVDPKDIVRELGLSSKWRVYHAKRRSRRPSMN